MLLAGIDGCPSGWIATVAEAGNPATVRLVHSPDLASLLTSNRIDFAVIDMPVGFVDGPTPRDVEAAMRQMLKGKASSVFPTPCRLALREMDYADACHVNEQGLGRRLPKQTFMLFPKMREVDAVVRDLGQTRLREGHPEVSFAVMAGTPVLSKKRAFPGAVERAALLERHGLPAQHLIGQMPRAKLAVDDVLDSAAMLWSADRFVRGLHQTFPSSPSRDAMGLEMSVIA